MVVSIVLFITIISSCSVFTWEIWRREEDVTDAENEVQRVGKSKRANYCSNCWDCQSEWHFSAQLDPYFFSIFFFSKWRVLDFKKLSLSASRWWQRSNTHSYMYTAHCIYATCKDAKNGNSNKTWSSDFAFKRYFYVSCLSVCCEVKNKTTRTSK